MAKMKGIFFSLVILFLMFSLFLILFIHQITIFESSEIISIKNRINSMITLIKAIAKDSEKAISIISKRAMNAAINYVITNGIGLNNANETIVELIVNGSINGTSQPLMENSTLKDWSSKMIYIASTKGFFASIDFPYIFVFMNDSFTVSVKYKIKIVVKDEKTSSNITKSFEKVVYSSILNLEDPLYPLNTYGRVPNYFKQSPHLLTHNTTQLIEDLNNSYYHISLNGASFFDRLEGKYFVQEKYKISNNYIGLESFVNKDKLLTSGIPINENQTNIDYLYFSNYNTTSYKIVGMPNNFRLDNETTIFNKTHLEIYNATIE
ncbi:MAG: hypothetical protein QXG91_00335 [Candidatus Aenigmatarchaeota archaeon]